MIFELKKTAAREGGNVPLWRNTALRADAWKALGASEYLTRQIRFGIRDMPTIPFKVGRKLPSIPQTEKDLSFASDKILKGVEGRVFEQVTEGYAHRCLREGKLISSAFVAWAGEGEDEKGRFVLNFHAQSKHWPKGSVKMETIPTFALEVEREDVLFSFDIESGFHHFYLHPDMRDYFLFHYQGGYYRCIALPFGWGRSGLWFTKCMRVLVQHMRVELGYRVLPYIDDFLVGASPPGHPATVDDVKGAHVLLEDIMQRLGLRRKVGKGCWEGSQTIEHLGFLIDTKAMRVYVSDRKVRRVRKMASAILLRAQRNRRVVSLDMLRRFCGVCVSLTLAVPLARFYTRSIYFDMSRLENEERAQSPQRRARDERSEEPPGVEDLRKLIGGAYGQSVSRYNACQAGRGTSGSGAHTVSRSRPVEVIQALRACVRRPGDMWVMVMRWIDPSVHNRWILASCRCGYVANLCGTCNSGAL